jgi:hypothetical protein
MQVSKCPWPWRGLLGHATEKTRGWSIRLDVQACGLILISSAFGRSATFTACAFLTFFCVYVHFFRHTGCAFVFGNS